MKITGIQVSNYQALTAVAVESAAPVLLFAGSNEAGKSSLLDAVKHAMLGEFSRVTLKKDIGQLVRDGAEGGNVTVRLGTDACTVVLPSGAWSAPVFEPRVGKALPFLLSPDRIAKLSPTDLRALLFQLAGLSASVPAVRAKLLQRGHDAARVDIVATVLLSGFVAAQDAAIARAREARALWKAITGETYGSVKATTWAAEAPAVDAAAIQQARAAEEVTRAEMEGIAASRAALGRLQADIDTTSQALVLARVKADLLAVHEADLVAAREAVEQQKAVVEKASVAAAGTDPAPHAPCPDCGSILSVAPSKVLRLEPYIKPTKVKDPAALQALTEARTLLATLERRQVAAQTVVDATKIAANDVIRFSNDLARLGERPTAEQLVDLDEKLRTVREQWEAQRIASDGLQRDLEKRAAAEKRTTDAQAAHVDLQAWEKLAEALSPDGIPGEMLTEAMTAFNLALRHQAELSGFAQVSVGPDMALRIDSRLYGLCSESAQWRADAQLAAAMSALSGARLFALDRLDVLDVAEQRMRALIWLHRLAESGEVDTVLVAGTLKAIPAAPATFDCYWLSAGESFHKEAA